MTVAHRFRTDVDGDGGERAVGRDDVDFRVAATVGGMEFDVIGPNEGEPRFKDTFE